MKAFIILSFYSAFFQATLTQINDNNWGKIVVEFTKEKKSSKANIITSVKSFSGLDTNWVQSLEKKFNQSIRMPRKAKRGKYIVSAKFILNKDGSIDQISCENDPGFGLCGEVIKELKRMQRRHWGPITISH